MQKISLIFLFGVFCSNLQGIDYYVSQSGNNSNNGLAQATAFRSIGKAAAVMRAGDRCLVYGGKYRENVVTPR